MIPPGLILVDAPVDISTAEQAKRTLRNGISPVELVLPYPSSRAENWHRVLRSWTTVSTDHGRVAAPQAESQTP